MRKDMRIRIIDGFGKAALVLALSFFMASVQTAFAHGGFEHVMGTVTKVSAQSVTVETTAKKSVEVGLTAKTTYTRGTKKVEASDMKAGDRVVIDATEVNEKLVAAEIKLGTAPAKSAHGGHTPSSKH